MADGFVEIEYNPGMWAEDWEKFFYILGEEIRDIVLERIQAGQCVDGMPLLDGVIDKYSPGYEAWKKDHGRDPYSSGDRFVLTGAMLGGFDVTDHSDEFVEIGFTDEELAARAYQNEMPTRLLGPLAKGKKRRSIQMRPTFSINKEELERAFQAAWLRIFGPPEE